MAETFAIGSDNYVLIKGIKDYQNNYMNDAIVTGVLQTAKGQPVAGVGPLVFTYIPDSNGEYEGIIPSTAAFENMKIHQIVLTVVGNGKTLLTKVRRIAKYDES